MGYNYKCLEKWLEQRKPSLHVSYSNNDDDCVPDNEVQDGKTNVFKFHSI